MAKKCVVVAYKSHKYPLLLQDLKTIIFREKRKTPSIPSYQKVCDQIGITEI